MFSQLLLLVLNILFMAAEWGSGTNSSADFFLITFPLALSNSFTIAGNAQYTALCIAGFGTTQVSVYGYNSSKLGNYYYEIKGN